MKQFNSIYLLTVFLILLSCGEISKREESQKKNSVQKLSEDSAEVSHLLNPNLASSDELRKFLNAEIVNEIEKSKPLLKTADFISILEKSISDEEVKAVCLKVFLPINLNTASKKEILSVPGVRDKMAHEFEEYRPYQSIEQFRREIGKYVSKEQVIDYEKYVFVPIDLNKGTQAEFLAIPGLGKKMLHEFEEYRPYQSMEQFRREIGKYVDDKELARLERYVVL